jgi:hypothetical protein
MPEFEVSYEIARCLSRSRYGTGAEFSRAMQAYLAAGPPKRGNSSPRQLSWSQTTEIVGGRFQDGTLEETSS